MVKNCHVHEDGKVERSPTKLFSVHFFWSFKFGNDFFIAFEILKSSFWKINISLLFRLLASEVLDLMCIGTCSEKSSNYSSNFSLYVLDDALFEQNNFQLVFLMKSFFSPIVKKLKLFIKLLDDDNFQQVFLMKSSFSPILNKRSSKWMSQNKIRQFKFWRTWAQLSYFWCYISKFKCCTNCNHPIWQKIQGQHFSGN